MKKEFLRLKDIQVKLDENIILQDINLSIYSGEIIGIYGLYDSGKTTLLDVITNQVPFSLGTVFFREQKAVPSSWIPYTARIRTDNVLVDTMKLWEAVLALRQTKGFQCFLPARFLKKEMQHYLDFYDLSLQAEQLVSTLNRLEYYMLEILKACLLHKQLILIDFLPTDFSVEEYRKFYSFLKKFTQQGISFLITSSSIQNLVYCTNSIRFLMNGSIIKTISPDAAKDETLELLIKNSILTVEPPESIGLSTSCQEKEPILVSHSCGISFSLHPKEMTAIIDLSDLLKSSIEQFFYSHSFSRPHHLTINGKPLSQVQQKHGTAWTDFNTTDKIIPSLSPLDNLCLNQYPHFARMGYMKNSSRQTIIHEFNNWYGDQTLMKQSDCYSINKREITAMLLFRLRLTQPKILFCKDFTAAADYASMELIHNELNILSQSGTAVCVFISNIENLNNFADRYIVLKNKEPGYPVLFQDISRLIK